MCHQTSFSDRRFSTCFLREATAAEQPQRMSRAKTKSGGGEAIQYHARCRCHTAISRSPLSFLTNLENRFFRSMAPVRWRPFTGALALCLVHLFPPMFPSHGRQNNAPLCTRGSFSRSGILTGPSIRLSKLYTNTLPVVGVTTRELLQDAPPPRIGTQP